MTNTNEAQALYELTDPTAAQLAALRGRLTDAAEGEGILDVAYTTIDTPVARCCSPPPPRASCGSPTRGRATTRCCRRLRRG